MAQRLPDEILEEIFLRLPTAADLARASAACVSYSRVIAGHPFLRRFRTLHPPPLLGIICGSLTPAQPPHPSAAAAATLADDNLYCSFLLQSRNRWRRRDDRDGRALFSPAPERTGGDCDRRELVREFAVCDPLHRCYLILPAVPDHLAGQVHPPDILKCEPFLTPPGDDEKSSFRDFRVMCLVWCKTKLVLFVFSSCSGQWLPDPVTFDVSPRSDALRRHYAHGCFCWHVYVTDSLLLLDARRMEFSVVDLPPPHCPRLGYFAPYLLQMAIVEAGEGRLGMLTVCKPSEYHLLYEEQCKDGNGANQWQSKSVISLPEENYCYGIDGVAGGYLLLHGSRNDRQVVVDYFSLNLQTFQIERFCQTDCHISGTLYAGLPPSLSPPTILSGLVQRNTMARTTGKCD